MPWAFANSIGPKVFFFYRYISVFHSFLPVYIFHSFLPVYICLSFFLTSIYRSFILSYRYMSVFHSFLPAYIFLSSSRDESLRPLAALQHAPQRSEASPRGRSVVSRPLFVRCFSSFFVSVVPRLLPVIFCGLLLLPPGEPRGARGLQAKSKSQRHFLSPLAPLLLPLSPFPLFPFTLPFNPLTLCP